MDSPVDYRRDGHVATLTLNTPELHNSLSPELVTALIAALEKLDADAEARCAILTGAGASFSAGGNPKRMLAEGLYVDMSPAELRRFYKQGIQRLPLAFQALDVPIIAAVNGAAIGAGCDLACLCDIRLAADSATFASSFVKLGIVPGDGGAWLLPRLIGQSNAMEMLLTGARIDAGTAQRMGLVSLVTSRDTLLEEALQRARQIAANPPHAVQLAKRLVTESRQLPLSAALELAASMQSMCHRMDDHREAVTAFLEKREPRFTGK